MNEYYHRFNETLLTTLNNPNNQAEKESSLKPDFKMPSVTASVMPDTPQEPSKDEPTGTGELIIEVTLARRAIPVEGATIIITKENDEDIISTLTTDKSGRTEKIALATQNSSFSQTPNSSAQPFSVYNVRVDYPGYYTERAINVPIFDGILSIQPIALIPLSEKNIADEELSINESQVLNN